MQSRLKRHLFRQHDDQNVVKKAMNLTGKEQDHAIDLIKKQGILKANRKLKTAGATSYHRERRTCTNKQDELLLCNGCNGFFGKKRMWKHKLNCQDESSFGFVNFSRSTCQETYVTEEFRENILNRFRNDEIGNFCRLDPVIVRYGSMLYTKRGKTSRKEIMSKMRLYAALVFRIRDLENKSDLTGEDVLHVKRFDVVTRAIEEVTINEGGNLKYGTRLTYGYMLKTVAKIMKGVYIIENDMTKSQDIDSFVAVLDLNWDFLFYSAVLESELKRTNLRKPSSMPLEEDVKKFKDYISSEIKKIVDSQYTFVDRHVFVRLRNLIVARLTLFNARRGGEPARMTLKEWEDAKNKVWVDPQLIENVSDPMEKEFIDQFMIAYQAGKGQRKLVPKNSILSHGLEILLCLRISTNFYLKC